MNETFIVFDSLLQRRNLHCNGRQSWTASRKCALAIQRCYVRCHRHSVRLIARRVNLVVGFGSLKSGIDRVGSRWFAQILPGLNLFAISTSTKLGNKNADLRRSQCYNALLRVKIKFLRITPKQIDQSSKLHVSEQVPPLYRSVAKSRNSEPRGAWAFLNTDRNDG